MVAATRSHMLAIGAVGILLDVEAVGACEHVGLGERGQQCVHQPSRCEPCAIHVGHNDGAVIGQEPHEDFGLLDAVRAKA